MRLPTSMRFQTAIRLPILALLVGLIGAPRLEAQQGSRSLTLEEALDLAHDSSDALAASRARVQEAARRSSIVSSNYLPRVETQANYLVNNNTQGILLPTGSLGNVAALGGPFPPEDLTISQGGTDFLFAFTSVSQPITHYFRIRHGVGAARADEVTADAGLRRAEQEVRLGVIQAYAGLLIAQRAREVAQLRAGAAEARVSYATASADAGSSLTVQEREARVAWLQARQEILEREDEIDDLNYTLVDLLGLEPDTRLRLDAPSPPEDDGMTLDRYVQAAVRQNPDLQEARALDDKANHGLGAARAAYIPEVGLLGAHLYQSSLPFLPRNTFGLGIQAKWTILDFGARSSAVDESRAQVVQAERGLRMVEGRVRGEVAAAYRRLERARAQLALAEEARELRVEGARLQDLQARAGYAVPAQRLEAEADELDAELDLIRARMGLRVALAELRMAAGLL